MNTKKQPNKKSRASINNALNKIMMFVCIMLLSAMNAYAVKDLMALQGTAYNGGSPIDNGNIVVT